MDHLLCLRKLDGTTVSVAIEHDDWKAFERIRRSVHSQTGLVAEFVEARSPIERCLSAASEAAIAAARATDEELMPPARHAALLDAIRNGDIEALRASMEGADGLDVNVAFPLQDDAEEGCWWIPLNLAAALGRVDVIKFLVSRGAALDGRDDEFYTEPPLSTAAALGRRASVIALHALGADPKLSYAHDPDYNTGVFGAAFMSGHLEIMHLCLDVGAPLRLCLLRDIMEDAPWTLIGPSASTSAPAQLLLSEIAKWESAENVSKGLEMLLACVCNVDLACCIPRLQSSGIDLARSFSADVAPAYFGLRPPLHCAVLQGRLATVTALLRCGVPVPTESDLQMLNRDWSTLAAGGFYLMSEKITKIVKFLRQVRRFGGYRRYIGGLRARVAATRQLYAEGRALPAVFGVGPDPSQQAFLRAQGVDAAVLVRLEATLRLSGVVQRIFAQPGDVFQAIVRYWIA